MTDAEQGAVAADGAPIFDFRHLRVQGKTAWFDISSAIPGARLQLKPATEHNDGYMNAKLALASKQPPRPKPKRSGEIAWNDPAVQKNRDDEVTIFARHVVVGWEGVTNREGRPVPFSEDAALALLRALPDWIVDRIRAFAWTPESFTTRPDELPAKDAGEIVPN